MDAAPNVLSSPIDVVLQVASDPSWVATTVQPPPDVVISQQASNAAPVPVGSNHHMPPTALGGPRGPQAPHRPVVLPRPRRDGPPNSPQPLEHPDGEWEVDVCPCPRDDGVVPEAA